MAFIYAELVAYGRNIMICPTKRYNFIFYMSLVNYVSICKLLALFIFFWIGEGLERRVVVVPIERYSQSKFEMKF